VARSVVSSLAGGIAAARSLVGDRQRPAPTVPGLRAVRDA
jgi:UDP-glucose 4-epimerase